MRLVQLEVARLCLVRLAHLALLVLRPRDLQALLGRRLLRRDCVRGLYQTCVANQQL